MNIDEMNAKILMVFRNREIDRLFIESATNLGHSEYFTYLDLNKEDDLQVSECYNRVIAVMNNIPMTMLPKKLIKTLGLFKS